MRIETDFLGEKQIPEDRYWGIHTQRAIANFQITGDKVSDPLIRAMACVKKAASQTNRGLGFLSPEIGSAIEQACDEIMDGKLCDEFPLDALQGGAGTSTHMNMNEVIANRALEILGHAKGTYEIIHPIEHVNKHQSTNDVFPTALKVAVIRNLRLLSRSVEQLQGAFQQKEKEFAKIVKIGRTELQEAVPMTLGVEFSAFAEAVARDRWRIFKCEERLRQVNLGGTAVGTGLCAPREYIFQVIENLRMLTGLNICRGENGVDQTANADAFVEVSGILKAHASNLIKIANDLRLLNLLKDIQLEQIQAGSSIMPGKVNPVICEAVMQAGMQAIAYDAMITEAVSRASLQINEFMPLVAHAFLKMLQMLICVNELFARHVKNIQANEEALRRQCDVAKTMITAFIPQIGYQQAEKLLKEFERSDQKNFRIFLEKQLGEGLVHDVLSPEKLTALGFRMNEDNTTE